MTSKVTKFRAWDNKKKSFPFYGFHIIGETTLFDLLNQYQIEKLVDLNITQFSGLKDKNGKDLYSGDLIFVDEEVWEIYFGMGCFLIRPYPLQEGQKPSVLYEYNEGCELVGNIFELFLS